MVRCLAFQQLPAAKSDWKSLGCLAINTQDFWRIDDRQSAITRETL